jgi:uncharacterized membrane protein YbhN (UPF0104 family)/pimeloyl-ACP methyl ester carboxylesterase
MTTETVGVAGTQSQRRAPLPSRHLTVQLLFLGVAIAAVTAVVVNAPSVSHDFTAAFSKIGPRQLPWLVVAVVAETISFFAYAGAQHRLLAAGGRRFPERTLLGLVVASTGLTTLLPAGAWPATGWLAGQYRRRDVPLSLAVWAVLAGGFAATVSVLGLLLLGAGIAGVGSSPVLVASAVVLVGGSAAFVAGVHRLGRLEEWFRRRGNRGPRWVRRVATASADLVGWRIRFIGGAAVFAYSIGNWLADAAVLAAAFGLVGQPTPWRGLLFAYATAQVAGSVIPLPGGIGAVEGGLVGALALTGVSVGHALAAAVVYRVIGYWAVGLVGTLALVVLTRRPQKAKTIATAAHPPIVTGDGVRLNYVHLPGPPDTSTAVVLAHGFTGALDKPYVRKVAAGLAHSAAVLAFDFRGHGASGGLSTVGECEIFDLAAMVQRARELGYDQVATVGWSMGASVAIRHAALCKGVDAVVAVSTVSGATLPPTGWMRFGEWLVCSRTGRVVARVAYHTRVAPRSGWPPDESPLALVGAVAPIPLLLIHGDRDTHVPLRHAHQLAAAAGQPTELWVVPGFGHAEAAADRELLDRIGGHLPVLLAAAPSRS